LYKRRDSIYATISIWSRGYIDAAFVNPNVDTLVASTQRLVILVYE
jgi:hypothetical protein